MRSNVKRILISVALCAAASSCANRVETQRTFPPVADLTAVAEPGYPIAALEPCPAGVEPCPAKTAEDKWWNDVLLWGRNHHDKVARICKWAVDLGMKAPDGLCVTS